MPDIRRLKQQLVPSSTDVGDGMLLECGVLLVHANLNSNFGISCGHPHDRDCYSQVGLYTQDCPGHER